MQGRDCLPERPSSPIHIHVNDLTPVHVHVKKHQRKSKGTGRANRPEKEVAQTKSSGGIDKSTMASEAIGLTRHPPARVRSRSRSPQHTGPWIPPPAKSTRGSKSSWQSSGHRMEMPLPPLKCDGGGGRDEEDDGDTEDDERAIGKMREYERTIEDLRMEVGCLKKQVTLQLTQKELERKEDFLNASVKLQDNREHEMNALKNSTLANSSQMPFHFTPKNERVILMKKLIEVEVDGQAVAAELDRLRDAIRRNRDSNVLGNLREKFFERLSIFEASNRCLRQTLREQHESEGATLRIAEERELLCNKLNQAEDILRSLESKLCQERAEADHLQKMLIDEKERSEQDKEALKKATRAQKDRASQSADALDTVNAELAEHQAIIRALDADMKSLRTHSDRISKEKMQATNEIARLNERIIELEGVFERTVSDSRRNVESTTHLLHERTSDLSNFRLENDRLKTSLSICEEKLSQTQTEMSRIQEVVHDYERRMDQYRTQVQNRLQVRLEELEPLPQLLKTTQLRLQEKTEEAEQLRQQQADGAKQIKDLSLQVAKQAEIENQRHELLLNVADKEDACRQANIQLQELTRENVGLQRQLEATSSAELKMMDGERQKQSAKERAFRTQIMDFEMQINQARSEIARVKREKDDAERKLKSQLLDAQGKLEQCESAKRCLQNYLHFIQTSYATTFGDPLTSSPSNQTFGSSRCLNRSPFL